MLHILDAIKEVQGAIIARLDMFEKKLKPLFDELERTEQARAVQAKALEKFHEALDCSGCGVSEEAKAAIQAKWAERKAEAEKLLATPSAPVVEAGHALNAACGVQDACEGVKPCVDPCLTPEQEARGLVMPDQE